MENKNEQGMEGKIAELEGKHFDIGVAGVWYGMNYGSVLTYYALYQTFTKLGYSVLMIDKQRLAENDWEIDCKVYARDFAAKHYKNISPNLKPEEMCRLNRYCDTFLMGCDQVWNYCIAQNFFLNNYFDYVADDKKKISYASSFGHNQSFTPIEKLPIVTKMFHRFDAISVREASAVQILKDEFGIEGTQVVDPVFLLEREEYEEILKDTRRKETEKFMFSYILDPTPEIREALIYVAEKKNLKLINMIDGIDFDEKGNRKKNRQILNLPDTMWDQDSPTWLWYISHAEFVVTDSCHGISFSLIFHKPFIAIANQGRGVDRFESLVDMMGIRDRYVYDVSQIKRDERLLSDMDYTRIDKIFEMERKRSLQWLKDVLAKEKKPAVTVKDCVSKKECCGCGACYQTCPVDAIHMDYDEEGILYPLVDEETCICCGKCVKVCPALHPYNGNKEKPECYAAYGDDDIRAVSSSGGIFTLAAEQVLEDGGAVCGASFNDKFELSQQVIYSKEELPKLQRSKYIQSNTKRTYQEIKKALESGKPALYVGTPCLVAGLRGYLGREYEKLYTIDLLCHGGPSPVSFQKYLKEVHGKKEVEYVGFRDKDYFKWGINATGMTVKYKDGSVYRRMKGDDLFYRAFTPALTVRPQCQVCNYARLPRQGDITLGDFWGVEKYNPKMTDGKGTSIVTVNSEKGTELLEKIRQKLLLLEKIDLNHILTHGQPYAKSFKTNPRRYRFLRMLKDCSFEKSLECCEGNKFDFALVGMNGDSYGEILGYYALYKAVAGRNYSVLMVKRPKEMEQKITPLKYRLTSFANRYYPAVSTRERLKQLPGLKKSCRGYMIDKIDAYGKYLGESKCLMNYEKALAGIDKEILLERQGYEELTVYSDCEAMEEYAVYDSRNISGEMEESIKRYAKEQSLKLVRLDEDMMAENWLYYIKNAEWIVSGQRDAINVAAIFEKKLLIPASELEESLKHHLEDMRLGNRLLKETEDIRTKLSEIDRLGYGVTRDIINQKRVYAQKELDRSIKIVCKNIRRKEKPLLKSVIKAGIRFGKRTLPPPVKERVKKMIRR